MKNDALKWQEKLKGMYEGEVGSDVPMSQYTSLGIGGPADIMLVPAEPLSVRNLMVLLKHEEIPFFTLGGGTNILVKDGGIEGVVINLRTFGRIEVLHESGEHAELFVEAGVPLQKLVNFCRDRGFSGMEGLTGIPGTVGGAIWGNAGSFGTEMKDVVVSAAVMDSSGRLDRYGPDRLGFRYRGSSLGPDELVLSANIRVRRDKKETVSSKMEGFIAEKKSKQPISERTAGCVFRNPEGIAAGRLMEEAGCKGMRVGNIAVSGLHANFFVNMGGGKASDFIALMDKVSEAVFTRSGVRLEPEIRIAGRA